MRWPAGQPLSSSHPATPPGYQLRQFGESDAAAYDRLMERAGMGQCPRVYWMNRILPNGFFVVEHAASGDIVAACFAAHSPAMPRYPFGGNFGWLAADPAHRGKALGAVVAHAVTSRLVAGGYENIYLTTDDTRLAAISLYLKMGWVPVLFRPDMAERWERVCRQLDWPYLSAEWPTG